MQMEKIEPQKIIEIVLVKWNL